MVKLKKGSAKAKAWGLAMKKARARKTKTPTKKAKTKSSNTVKKGGLKMAKRKVVRKKKSTSNTSKPHLMYDVGMPVLYGFSREFISDGVDIVATKMNVPIGGITDELLIGTLAFIGNKKLKNAKLKKILKNVVVIESARLGEAVKDLGFGNLMK